MQTVYITGLVVFFLSYWCRDEFDYYVEWESIPAFILALIWPFFLVLAVFSKLRNNK